MDKVKLEKILKYVIWAGLIAVFFIPLIVRGSFYFPYIVPKTLAFKIIVEVSFLALLILAAIKKDYRPKLNLVLILFFLYLVVVSVSSLINGTFYFSFWSNNERSEGLLLLFHLMLYLIILISFIRRTEDWLILFDASFLGSLLVALVGLSQYFNFSWILASGAGERIASTIGNAGYVGGYLIFNVFFGFLLFLFRKNKYLRWYYIFGIILQIFVILNTQTRGAILALSFASFIFILYLAFFYFKEKKAVRRSGMIILLLMVIFAGLVFKNKEAAWVRKNSVLSRVADISAKSTTAQDRLMCWQAAWQGFKEKPLLGYGYENFYQVFDKYFNPKIYRDIGSVVWFDRAHNIIFDRLVSGGAIGLLLYLGMLLIPLYFIWKHFRKEERGGRYFLPMVFTLIMAAYFIQNFFIFEALVTYIPLFVCLAFLAQFCPSLKSDWLGSNKPYLILLVIDIIFFVPFMYSANIKPALANQTLIEAMVRKNINQYKESYDYFIKAIDMGTAGNQEYRQHFGEFVSSMVNIQGIDYNWLSMAASRAEQEFDQQIKEKPKNSRNYIMFMRYLNETHPLSVVRLEKSLLLFKKGTELSPTRPHFYYEVGFSQYYLGYYYQSKGESEKTRQYYSQAIDNFQKAIDLNDQVIDSYSNMIVILLSTGQTGKIQSYLDQMDRMGLNYHAEYYLKRLGSASIKAKAYQWTYKFYLELTKIASEVPDYWINLALSYAYLGENQKAIEIAESVKGFGGEYNRQADLFIQDVKEGKYIKQ